MTRPTPSPPPSSSPPPSPRPRLPRFWVYLLVSRDGRIYTGYTSDLRRRFKEHNHPQNTGYTRGRKWHLLATKCYPDKASALRAERQLKRSKYDKRNLLRRTQRLRILCERHGIVCGYLRGSKGHSKKEAA